VAGATVRELVAEVAERLEAAGSTSGRADAEILVSQVLGVTRSTVRASLFDSPSDDVARRLEPLVARRAAGEPLQYVLGEWGFRRLTLSVDRRALIPRPETEVVVERCLALLAGVEAPRVLDVGTGSGAIALAIADEHPDARVTGVDASVDALSLARENAARTGLSAELLEHDLFDGLPAGPWELVVSNPPYVDPGDGPPLAREVADWEPPIALYGRDATPAVARGALPVLVRDGWLVLEVGDGQATGVAALLESLGYGEPVVTPDLAGRDRVVEARVGS
jgi:release factor glutamine methyltransferase